MGEISLSTRNSQLDFGSYLQIIPTNEGFHHGTLTTASLLYSFPRIFAVFGHYAKVSQCVHRRHHHHRHHRLS